METKKHISGRQTCRTIVEVVSESVHVFPCLVLPSTKEIAKGDILKKKTNSADFVATTLLSPNHATEESKGTLDRCEDVLTFLESVASAMIASHPLKVATWKSEM